jgi:hypothetical protein
MVFTISKTFNLENYPHVQPKSLPPIKEADKEDEEDGENIVKMLFLGKLMLKVNAGVKPSAPFGPY